MSCRCDDIDRAEGDMNVMRDCEDRVSDVKGYYDELKEYYSDLISKFKVSIYSSDYKLTNSEKRILGNKTDRENDILNYRQYISDNISSLDSSLGRMEREDERYHSDDD